MLKSRHHFTEAQLALQEVQLGELAEVKAELQATVGQLQAELQAARFELSTRAGDEAALASLPIPQVEAIISEAPLALARLQAHLASRLQAELLHKQKEAFERRAECVICMEAAKAICFVPCGHVLACAACATQLVECPSCRAPIAQKITMFDT